MPRRLILAAILVAGLVLRVWHNDYGLPFIWGIDEGTHFTNRAVDMFREGLDPGYYQNPTAYTYLVYFLLRLMYGPLGFAFDLPWGNVAQQFDKDPTEIWIAARALAAVLCMGGVATAYVAARRIWGTREGLVAAAVLSFAFLPVAYSRVAVTDAGALIGISLSLLGSVRAAEGRGGRWYVVAGAAAGLAVAFKFTAGLALLPLGVAALARLREERWGALLGLALGVAAAALVFFALNPDLLLNFSQFRSDLRGQADVTANVPKPGQESGGFSYYLDSLGWGLGWAAAVAAALGAALELRRSLVRGLVLVAMPVTLFLYLSLQSRYFGRWLLPAYPALAMLAAVAIVRVAELLPARPGLRATAMALLAALVLAQPVAADVRTGVLLGREDTRVEARDWLVARYPPQLRISIEPAVPLRYYRTNPSGVDPPWLRRCPERGSWPEPGWSYPVPGGGRTCRRFKPGQFARPDGGVRASAYHYVLDPKVIDQYRRYGYCLVLTFGIVRERVLGSGRPQAAAYYRRLELESRLLKTFSPYDPGSNGVPFSFDLSYNYEPTEYERPGPVARIYRLDRCKQRYGPPAVRIPRAREVPPGVPPDEF
jgi:dolichyl-phosphate-mannose-protein mannosyltransferase